MAKLLEGKVAVVTGSGRGLGRGEAIYLAKEGAKVVVNDVGGHFDGTGAGQGPADEVVAEIKAAGGEAVSNYSSVSDFQAAKGLLDTAIEKFGQLNIVVNNAGILRDRMLFNMSEEEWDAVIAVHLKGTWNCMRHACGYWREQHKAGNNLKGKFVNTVSDAGLLGNVGQTNYGAAKAAIAALSMIVGREMSRYGVVSNCVAPMARTRLTTEATPSMAGLMGAAVPEGQFDMQDPDNMAPLVAFLSSDLADNLNGEVFRLMGNRVWMLRGWHNVDTIAKSEMSKWTPQELDGAIKGMVEKAGPQEDLTAMMMQAMGGG